MALMRDSEAPVADLDRQTVCFGLREGETRVCCQVSFMVLSDKREGRRVTTADQALAIFAQHREEFEAVAARKHAAGRVESDGSVFVASGDLSSKGWVSPA